MATAQDIQRFKAAFKVKAQRKNSGIRWDPPTGKLKIFQSQTHLAPVVAALDVLATDISEDNIDTVLRALRALPTSKDTKYQAAISELKASIVDLRKELTQAAMDDIGWDGVDDTVVDDLKGDKALAKVAAATEGLEQDIRKPQLDLVCDEIRSAEAVIRKAEKPPKDDDPARATWVKPDLSARKAALKNLRAELRTPLEERFAESDLGETTAFADPVQRAIVGRKEEWKPGKVAVTDLTRFPQCVGKGMLGQLAALGSEDYVDIGDEARDDAYYKPSTGAPRDATGFLNQWEKRQDALADDKTGASECSNFSYDAIAECLMDDTLSAAYDVLQVGTMGGQHNIAVLVPKGQGKDVKAGKGPLPAGSLIVDPWARAMGQDAEASLFASPDKFAYANSLYPMTINFNSTDEVRKGPFAPAKTTDDLVAEFKEKRKLKEFYDAIGSFLELDDNFAGATATPSGPLQAVVRNTLKLPDDTPVTHVEMNRESGILNIQFTSDTGTETVDRDRFMTMA